MPMDFGAVSQCHGRSRGMASSINRGDGRGGSAAGAAR
jgi:hypothetical protein